MRFRKQVSLAIILLSVALYILLPTLDEVFIHPVFGLFLSQILDVPIIHGTLLSVIIYRSIGVVCLLGALLIGGKPIYQKTKSKIQKDTTIETENLNPNLDFQCGGWGLNPHIISYHELSQHTRQQISTRQKTRTTRKNRKFNVYIREGVGHSHTNPFQTSLH